MSVFINTGIVSAIIVNKETLKIENSLVLNFPFESNSFFRNNTRANLNNLFSSIKNKFSQNYNIEKVIITTDQKDLNYEYDYLIQSESKILDYISFYVDPYNINNKYNLGPNNNDVANYIYYKQDFPIKLNGLYHASLINEINHKIFTKQIISTYALIDEKFLEKYLENYLRVISRNTTKEISIIFDPKYELIAYISVLTILDKKIAADNLKNIESLIYINIKIVQNSEQINKLLLLDDSTKQEYNFIYNINNA